MTTVVKQIHRLQVPIRPQMLITIVHHLLALLNLTQVQLIVTIATKVLQLTMIILQVAVPKQHNNKLAKFQFGFFSDKNLQYDELQ